MTLDSRPNPGALDGRRVVVVGGTSGMGLGAARAAAAAGADVVVAGRRSGARQQDGDRFTRVALDVTDEAGVAAAFDAIGALDHLLVTAAPAPGSSGPGAFLDQDVAAARRYLDAKLFGSWACARYAAPRMPPGGSITFLTGCAAIRPRAGASMITASFAALEALSQALALELGPLRVNAIRPGLVDSAMWDAVDPAVRQRLHDTARARFPARRIGTIDDIGHAAVFLMTNPYVTGTILEVSGGEPLVSLE
jgi:NAD(P)-dependent dehydrogenase (short-subunit alcohol dehydrogenase family)